MTPAEQIEAHKHRLAAEAIAIPAGMSMQEIVEGVIRGTIVLSAQQTRVLIAYLPRVLPKLMAVANVTEGSFAKMLDAAIERSNGPLKLIEVRPLEEPRSGEHSADELKGPFTKLERY